MWHKGKHGFLFACQTPACNDKIGNCLQEQVWLRNLLLQGFYQCCRADKGSLVIGPYQGSHGCIRIPIGRGVCGVAALERKSQLVTNVHNFPGHIACASL